MNKSFLSFQLPESVFLSAISMEPPRKKVKTDEVCILY